MPESHHFLTNLALVLCVAALTSLIFQRLRQPVVFGYLVAGMIVGPYIPLPGAPIAPIAATAPGGPIAGTGRMPP